MIVRTGCYKRGLTLVHRVQTKDYKINTYAQVGGGKHWAVMPCDCNYFCSPIINHSVEILGNILTGQKNTFILKSRKADNN